MGYGVITGGLHPDHVTIARFWVRHQAALGGLFSQVLRPLAAEDMVSPGTLGLDGTKLAGNAAQKANRTLPQIDKLLAEAAAAYAAEDAGYGDAPIEPTRRTLAYRAERRARLARARDWLAAENQARRDAQRVKQEAWDAAAAAGKRGGHRPVLSHRARTAAITEPRANITGPDMRVMRNQNGYVARLQRATRGHRGPGHRPARCCPPHPVHRTLLHPLPGQCRNLLTAAGIRPKLRTVLADSGYVSEDTGGRGVGSCRYQVVLPDEAEMRDAA